MDTCETCGNEYDNTFTIEMEGKTHVFDSFECAIHRLAPNCVRCGCRILGHGVQVENEIFCCAHCSEAQGRSGIRDRIELSAAELA